MFIIYEIFVWYWFNIAYNLRNSYSYFLIQNIYSKLWWYFIVTYKKALSDWKSRKNDAKIKEICIPNDFQIRTKLRNILFIGYEGIQAIDRSHHLRFVLFTLYLFVISVSVFARKIGRELTKLYYFSHLYIFPSFF